MGISCLNDEQLITNSSGMLSQDCECCVVFPLCPSTITCLFAAHSGYFRFREKLTGKRRDCKIPIDTLYDEEFTFLLATQFV